jgi:dihydrolipoamide dehydrogenase
MKEVNLITIGAGGGAYPAAFRLARAGQKVVMVDKKGLMSGNCLAEGCVPSKAIREAAGVFRQTQHMHNFGLSGSTAFDYSEVVAHKNRVQTLRYEQHGRELAEAKDHLKLIKGTARLIEPHIVEIETDAGLERYHADNIIIASGSDVAIPPIPGADLCITSRDIYGLNPPIVQPPKRIAIIGGGYIGLETASILSIFGVRVHVMEMMEQVLPGMDSDFVSLLVSLLDPRIELILEAQVERVDRKGELMSVHYSQDGQQKVIEGEQVMMAAGRRPVIPEGSEAIGLEFEHRGLKVNAALQTNFPHIYACGDVNGRSPLFHSAVRQSIVAAHNILAGNTPIDYMDFSAVPTTIFTFPEAAYIGITRNTAKNRGLSVVETGYAFTENARAQIFGETAGEVRLFFDVGSLRLVGGWVVGIDAANLINEIGLGVSSSLTAHDLARFPGQHPMAAEGISEAARSLF